MSPVDKRKLVPVLVGVLLAAGTSALLVAGQQGSGGAPDEVERTVDVRTGQGGVEIHLDRKDRASQDPVTVGFSTRNATLDVVYQGEREGETHRLEVKLETLLEYRDSNGNGSFDSGEPVPSAWGVGREDGGQEQEDNGSVTWGSASVRNLTRHGHDGQRVLLPARIGETGSFELRMQAFGEGTEVQNTTLKPTGVQIDLVVDYPFEANETDLAMLVTVHAAEGVEIGSQHRAFGEDEEGIVVTRRGERQAANLLFAWRENATVDGRPLPVEKTVIPAERAGQAGVTSPQEEQRRRSQYNGNGTSVDAGENVSVSQFGLSYERGDRIVHRAKAEVAIASIDDANAAPALSVGLALAALAAAGVLHRRTGPA